MGFLAGTIWTALEGAAMFFHPNNDMWGTERRNQSTEEASGEKSNTDGTDVTERAQGGRIHGPHIHIRVTHLIA